jgi:hypothetical protein
MQRSDAVSEEQDFETCRSALLAEIEEAFDGVAREDSTTLHEAIVMDDYGSEEEQRAARRLDVEKRWQDVPDEDITSCCSALSFLDAKGFRYYIPAFMTYALKHWGDDWNDILNSCQFQLTHESQKPLRKSEPASIARKYGFTGAQCVAVAHFLRFIIDFDMSMAAPAEVGAVEKWEKFVRELEPA